MAFRINSAESIDAFFLMSHKMIAPDIFSQVIEEINFTNAARELGMFGKYNDIVDLKANIRIGKYGGQVYGKKSKIDITTNNNKTDVQYLPGHFAWSMRSYYHDRIDKEKSKTFLKDIFKIAKEEVYEDAPMLIESQIFSDNDASSTKKGIDGLQFLLPTTHVGAPGGIDKAITSNNYWRHKILNMTGKSFSVHGVRMFRDMVAQCEAHGSGRIKLICTTIEIYNAMKNLGALETETSSGNKDLDISPRKRLYFEGAVVVWSKNVPSGHAYFLNPLYLSYLESSGDDMYMHPAVTVENSPGDMTWAITKTMSVKIKNMRAMGVAFGIKTEESQVIQ